MSNFFVLEVDEATVCWSTLFKLELIEEKSLLAYSTTLVVRFEEVDELNSGLEAGVFHNILIFLLDVWVYVHCSQLNRREAVLEVVILLLIVRFEAEDKWRHIVSVLFFCSSKLVQIRL